MSNILVVEDEREIQDIIKVYMKTCNHTVFSSYDGMDALTLIKGQQFDLVILDIMLPTLDGFSICKIIRDLSSIPIIILTAKSSENNKLKGYQYGADDYMTKPFSPRVLVAKTNALLQRSIISPKKDSIQYGTLELVSSSREVYSDGKKIDLTYKEFELLLLFMNNPNQVFSREQLLDIVWGYDFAGNTRTVDSHIKNLRQKLVKNGDYIVTLIRSGYKFEN